MRTRSLVAMVLYLQTSMLDKYNYLLVVLDEDSFIQWGPFMYALYLTVILLVTSKIFYSGFICWTKDEAKLTSLKSRSQSCQNRVRAVAPLLQVSFLLLLCFWYLQLLCVFQLMFVLLLFVFVLVFTLLTQSLFLPMFLLLYAFCPLGPLSQLPCLPITWKWHFNSPNIEHRSLYLHNKTEQNL